MSKNKLERFAENQLFTHLFQPTFDELIKGEFLQKGKWLDYFGNNNPISLELGCGKGEYTIALAKLNPNINYIGVDIKGARLWRGAKIAIENNLKNVAFLRIRIDFILKTFDKDEISEIWITFPDPQPHKAKKRLTSLLFLEQYKVILKQNSIIHLKTDNSNLFQFTLSTIEEQQHKLLMHTFDLYNSDINNEAKLTQTHYENLFLNQNIPIKYLQFQLNSY